MKHHILFLLAVLLVSGVIVSPISAAEYSSTLFPSTNTTSYYGEQVTSFTLNAHDRGEAVGLIYFTVPSNSQIDFTLYYGNQSSVTGYVKTELLTGWDLGWSLATVNLNGVNNSYRYFDLNRNYDIEIAGYARMSNNTEITGFMVSSDMYGIGDNTLAVFYPVSSLSQNLIYQVSATGTYPFNIEVVTAPYQDVGENVAHTPLEGLNNWLNYAFSVAGAIKGFLESIFWLLRFFFIDNLLLVIALYISVTMAYSAISSRDIFQFYRRFFRLQKTIIEFLVNLWNILVSIIGTMVQIFVKWL